MGERWVASGYCFTQENGRPLLPNEVSRTFLAFMKRSGLPAITLHDLRHSFATIALNERRAPISQVSARLGHRNPTITLAIYTHAIAKQDEGLAADVASAIVPTGF